MSFLTPACHTWQPMTKVSGEDLDSRASLFQSATQAPFDTEKNYEKSGDGAMFPASRNGV
jgi:hypothetical protein